MPTEAKRVVCTKDTSTDMMVGEGGGRGIERSNSSLGLCLLLLVSIHPSYSAPSFPLSNPKRGVSFYTRDRTHTHTHTHTLWQLKIRFPTPRDNALQTHKMAHIINSTRTPGGWVQQIFGVTKFVSLRDAHKSSTTLLTRTHFIVP